MRKRKGKDFYTENSNWDNSGVIGGGERVDFFFFFLSQERNETSDTCSDFLYNMCYEAVLGSEPTASG